MDSLAESQLAVIDQVHRLLDTASVDHWLFGGWGIDFLAGEITRPHTDVEFVIWKRDIDRIRGPLARRGFRERSNDEPDVRAVFDAGVVRLEMYYIERNWDGEIVTPGIYAAFPWAEDSFEDQESALGGVHLPVISAREQLLTKEVYVGRTTGRPLRPKDQIEHASARPFKIDNVVPSVVPSPRIC